jgi:acetyl-CoA acetyltransferase
MADAYIIDAARTPRGIGKQGKGALAEIHPGRQPQRFKDGRNR